VEKQLVNQKNIYTAVAAAPYLLKFPQKKMWIDYDKKADVLYISFKRPQKATDSEMTENGILLRYRGEELVGITILDASTRG
jgi:uncharacterized protein YuzE